jgi:hypothetical protein
MTEVDGDLSLSLCFAILIMLSVVSLTFAFFSAMLG